MYLWEKWKHSDNVHIHGKMNNLLWKLSDNVMRDGHFSVAEKIGVDILAPTS